jgi:hypothetical protein
MINPAHVHLMTNHIPVVGVMGAILLLLYGIVRKSEEVKMLSFGIFVLIALITIPVYLSGGAAEDIVKNMPGVSEKIIRNHDNVAAYALVTIMALGITAFTGLISLRKSGRIPNVIIPIVLALSLIAAAVIGVTANLGGQIRHTEIRSVVLSAPVPGPGK